MGKNKKNEWGKSFIAFLTAVVLALIASFFEFSMPGWMKSETHPKSDTLKETHTQAVDPSVKGAGNKKTKSGRLSGKSVTVYIQDAETGANLPDVAYTIMGIDGKSDHNGTIVIDLDRLNVRTDYDMFTINLSKEGYASEQNEIGIKENRTLKLHRE